MGETMAYGDPVNFADRSGSRERRRAERRSLDAVAERIGGDVYKRIIATLVDGGVGDLSAEDRKLISKIREEMQGSKH